MQRTSHGSEKHTEASRPTSEAAIDKVESNEIYLDIETGYYVFVGAKGRTHVFTAENLHHTSFWTTKHNRLERQKTGKWERIVSADLPEKLK